MKPMKRPMRCMVYSWLWLALAYVVSASAQPKPANLPNLIVITTDDQRHDVIGALNRGASVTPGLDRLVKRSLVFTDAHAVFALCSPSRAAILTGQYGSRNGVPFLDGALNEPRRSVAHHLRERGYQTAVSGKWHLKTTPAEAGFDWAVTFYANGPWHNREVKRNGETVRPAELVDVYAANESARYLRERKRDQPFFLWHCTQLPHMDGQLRWPVTQKSLALYDPLKMSLPRTWNELAAANSKPPSLNTARNRTQALQYGYDKPERIRQHTSEYFAAISDLDDALAPLWKALDAEKLWENTYVIFLGDNGWLLGEHGLTSKVLAYAPSSQIPLMVAGPGLRAGRSAHLALNIDIAPTVLSLAGVAIPSGTQGQALPLARNKAVPREAFVYEGLEGYGGTKPFLATISARWKLIYTWDESAQVSNVPPVFVELYDRQRDPDEAHNLAAETKLRKIRQQLAQAIDQHLAELKRN
jgi:arylsulfatase A-like enzyme